MKSDLYKRGYKWANKAHQDGDTLQDIEDKADNSFDFNDFDRGALDAVHDLRKENKT
ncbi:hypothetical protein [Aeromonas phage Riv-10]|nr:hypothetical protein [Aeromonas phage Riv-10]